MTTESSTTIYQGAVVTLTIDRVVLPNGNLSELEIVRHPGGVAIVAIDEEENVCLIRQYRHAVQEYIWEIPAGKREQHCSAQQCAMRELREEAGREAQDWVALSPILSSPGVFDEVIFLYLARKLHAVPMALERDECLVPHWLPLRQACMWALSGEIQDAKTVIALLRAQAILNA